MSSLSSSMNPSNNSSTATSTSGNSNSHETGNLIRDGLFQKGRLLATTGSMFARSSLDRFQKMDLSSRVNDTKQRLSLGVQELDLSQRYSESKQRLAEGVSKLKLDEKLIESKEKLRAMNIDQRFVEGVQKLKLEQKLTDSKEKLRAMNLEQHLGTARTKLGGITEQLQKINLAKLIDKMESDQAFADDLERKNRDRMDEQAAREMMRESELRCMEAIEKHLATFLEEHPDSTYEDWIQDLHPDNLSEGRLLEGLGKELDHRLYVEESDHRLMWNRNLAGSRREVPARSQMRKTQEAPIVDLLDTVHVETPAEMKVGNANEDDDDEDLVDILLSSTDHTPMWDSNDLIFDNTSIPISPAPEPTLMGNLDASATAVDTANNIPSTSQAADDLFGLVMNPKPGDQLAPWVREATGTGTTSKGDLLIDFY